MELLLSEPEFTHISGAFLLVPDSVKTIALAAYRPAK